MTQESPSAAAGEGLLGAADRDHGGRRFAFGQNWANFLKVLNENRITEAERSLREMLAPERLRGASFLDAGCGSGLFSLAAMRLGAGRVHSFDFDSASVACARELRQRYFQDSGGWTVERGSVLDAHYLEGLGTWDIVYSWGVLHHTGRMWDAIDLVTRLVKPSGVLFIGIYNDQGLTSRAWTAVKRLYNRNALGRATVLSLFIPYFAVRGVVGDLLRLRNPLTRYRQYYQSRGMSMVHDWIDWLGGYPFEVATPEQVIEFCTLRGFSVQKLLARTGTLGCNEFVFRAPEHR